jgi:hypothetical protein
MSNGGGGGWVAGWRGKTGVIIMAMRDGLRKKGNTHSGGSIAVGAAKKNPWLPSLTMLRSPHFRSPPPWRITRHPISSVSEPFTLPNPIFQESGMGTRTHAPGGLLFACILTPECHSTAV